MHKVVFWRGAKELAEKPWPYGLDTAKAHARDHLPIYAATHVEVIDMASHAVVFRYAGEASGE